MAEPGMYHTDFYAWTLQQAELLRKGRIGELDLLNLAEEVESMGRRERQELSNRMKILVSHLLKWQFQSWMQNNSWRNTIREQRRQIVWGFEDTPSLKAEIAKPEWFSRIWTNSVALACDETGLRKSSFPEDPIWTLEQILSEDWFPEAEE